MADTRPGQTSMRSFRKVPVGRLLERAHFASFPQPAAMDEYDQAADEILTLLTQLPGTVAVYRTGQISALGISDIDFILVIDGSAVVPSIWERLTPRARYLAMHSPAVVDPEAFAKHRWFSSAEPLERTWGDSIAVAERPFRPYADLVLAAEGLTTGLLRLVKQAGIQRVKVRPILCELNALRYDLALADVSGTRHSPGWQFVEDIRALRANWFSSSPAALKPILRRAVPIIELVMQELAAEVLDRGLSSAPDESSQLRMRLRGPWANVTVKVDRERDAVEVEGPWWVPLAGVGRSLRRVGELKWRLGRWSVALPGEVVRLLAGEATAEYRDFVSEREQTVRRYRAFVSSRAPGYGMLGTAANYVTSDR